MTTWRFRISWFVRMGDTWHHRIFCGIAPSEEQAYQRAATELSNEIPLHDRRGLNPGMSAHGSFEVYAEESPSESFEEARDRLLRRVDQKQQLPTDILMIDPEEG